MCYDWLSYGGVMEGGRARFRAAEGSQAHPGLTGVTGVTGTTGSQVSSTSRH